MGNKIIHKEHFEKQNKLISIENNLLEKLNNLFEYLNISNYKALELYEELQNTIIGNINENSNIINIDYIKFNNVLFKTCFSKQLIKEYNKLNMIKLIYIENNKIQNDLNYIKEDINSNDLKNNNLSYFNNNEQKCINLIDYKKAKNTFKLKLKNDSFKTFNKEFKILSDDDLNFNNKKTVNFASKFYSEKVINKYKYTFNDKVSDNDSININFDNSENYKISKMNTLNIYNTNKVNSSNKIIKKISSKLLSIKKSEIENNKNNSKFGFFSNMSDTSSESYDENLIKLKLILKKHKDLNTVSNNIGLKIYKYINSLNSNLEKYNILGLFIIVHSLGDSNIKISTLITHVLFLQNINSSFKLYYIFKLIILFNFKFIKLLDITDVFQLNYDIVEIKNDNAKSEKTNNGILKKRLNSNNCIYFSLIKNCNNKVNCNFKNLASSNNVKYFESLLSKKEIDDLLNNKIYKQNIFKIIVLVFDSIDDVDLLLLNKTSYISIESLLQSNTDNLIYKYSTNNTKKPKKHLIIQKSALFFRNKKLLNIILNLNLFLFDNNYIRSKILS